MWNLVKLPGACLKLKLPRTLVALALDSMSGGERWEVEGGMTRTGKEAKPYQTQAMGLAETDSLAAWLIWRSREVGRVTRAYRCQSSSCWKTVSNCRGEYKHILSTASKTGDRPEGVLPLANSSSKYFACLEFSLILENT